MKRLVIILYVYKEIAKQLICFFEDEPKML